jgi:hypothetical protein
MSEHRSTGRKTKFPSDETAVSMLVRLEVDGVIKHSDSLVLLPLSAEMRGTGIPCATNSQRHIPVRGPSVVATNSPAQQVAPLLAAGIVTMQNALLDPNAGCLPQEGAARNPTMRMHHIKRAVPAQYLAKVFHVARIKQPHWPPPEWDDLGSDRADFTVVCGRLICVNKEVEMITRSVNAP